MPNGFCHIELTTDDLAKAKKFYKGLFKWKLSDFEGGYILIDAGSDAVGGGMMETPQECCEGSCSSAPKPKARAKKESCSEPCSHWTPYVEVADVKKSIAKAKKLGATIQIPYMEIPHGMGSFGCFIDPAGAAIGVWAAAPKKKAKKK